MPAYPLRWWLALAAAVIQSALCVALLLKLLNESQELFAGLQVYADVTDKNVAQRALAFTTQSVEQQSQRVLKAMQSDQCYDKQLRRACKAYCPAGLDPATRRPGGRFLNVIVSHEHKLIYLEVHKAASTTVRLLLKRALGIDLDTAMIKSNRLDPSVFDRYFIFTFVRDPLPRFTSSHDEYKQQRRKRNASLTVNELASLTQSLALLEAGVRLNNHFATQISEIEGTRSDGRPIPITFIGHVESFDRDFAYVMTKLGRKPISQILPANVKPASHRTGWEAVSNDLQKRVCRVYMLDFVCLGFSLPPVCDEKDGMM
ncbi:hypothetical protein FVE85_5450 [Porphyridium purpureum]|uniref:Uncharacterized protein n=1 Tax=Porphyridium purpureum TaxID=35688 RepID=A0A5J4Z3J2_PORPP|nr:hypothetical protein FVE85_5450 [Porphyridium purpureum]|eukprot:POR0361..scf295_1